MNQELDPLLAQAYAPESFRAAGHRMVDTIADALAANQAGDSGPTFPWLEPDAALAHWQAVADSNPTLEDVWRQVLERSVRIGDPRFLGHQICAPAPDAILASLLGDYVNNGSAVFEMGMAGIPIEKIVVDTVAKHFGMSDQAGGFMTSGGTLANVTALLAARGSTAPSDWQDGTEQQLSVLVSDQSHYCVDRAVRVMGWGEEGIVSVPSDDRFRMRTELLSERLRHAESLGRRVVAVVGCAGSTATGSFDDFQAIARFCRDRELWFHIDGAHGAPIAFSRRHRRVLAGIEQADSVVIDFHKMLMTPAITSAVIFARDSDADRTFPVDAEYLFANQPDGSWIDPGKRTFECTKTMMALKVFATLVSGGTELWEANIDRLFAQTAVFVDLLRQRANFEVAVEPDCNIVCYRYRVPHGTAAEQSALNTRIRQQVIRRGQYYIVQTMLRGEVWLRSAISNPRSDQRVFAGLLDEIESIAASLAAPDTEIKLAR